MVFPKTVWLVIAAALLISSIARKPSLFTVLPFGNLRTQSSNGSIACFFSSTCRRRVASPRKFSW